MANEAYLTEGFDHEGFAKDLAFQAESLIPKDIKGQQKKFIVEVVYKFCLLTGEALNNDKENSLDVSQAKNVTRFVGEWTFHKAVDLIRGEVDPNLREEILRKVAFTIFEVAKQAATKPMTQEEISRLVERHVNRSFKSAITELTLSGVLNKKAREKVLKESNIDEPAKVKIMYAQILEWLNRLIKEFRALELILAVTVLMLLVMIKSDIGLIVKGIQNESQKTEINLLKE